MCEWLPLPRRRLETIENGGCGAEARGPGSLQGQQEASGQTLNMLLKFSALQPLQIPPLQEALVPNQAHLLHRREQFARI